MVGVGLGILLMAVSFIFWKLDERVRFLIKHAESALKWIEAKYDLEGYDDESHVLRLFTSEETRTADDHPFTYSRCFRWTFLVFGLIGLAGAILSATCMRGS